MDFDNLKVLLLKGVKERNNVSPEELRDSLSGEEDMTLITAALKELESEELVRLGKSFGGKIYGASITDAGIARLARMGY